MEYLQPHCMQDGVQPIWLPLQASEDSMDRFADVLRGTVWVRQGRWGRFHGRTWVPRRGRQTESLRIEIPTLALTRCAPLECRLCFTWSGNNFQSRSREAFSIEQGNMRKQSPDLDLF